MSPAIGSRLGVSEPPSACQATTRPLLSVLTTQRTMHLVPQTGVAT